MHVINMIFAFIAGMLVMKFLIDSRPGRMIYSAMMPKVRINRADFDKLAEYAKRPEIDALVRQEVIKRIKNNAEAVL